MKKWSSAVAVCFALAGFSADLVDFRTPGVAYPIYSGAYRTDVAAEQFVIDSEGLTLRTDPKKEKSPAQWLSFGIPVSLGGQIDWSGKRFVLVMPAPPTGRMKSNMALDFTDRNGEIFQFIREREFYNSHGEFCLVFDLNGPHAHGWGDVSDNRLDAPLHLSSGDIHFVSAIDGGNELTGVATLTRIVDGSHTDSAMRETPRTVKSVEPIDCVPKYPGAMPFPGAKTITCHFAPNAAGEATLTLSHGSIGTAAEGILERFKAPVRGGVATFALDLPYTNQYEFISVTGGGSMMRAEGTFLQTGAEAMRLSAETGNPLHLVRDESERPHLTVTNPSERAHTWKTVFVLSDVFGRQVKIPFSAIVAAGASERIELPWPLPAKGLWRVRANVAAEDGSKAVKETRFAYIDRHTVTPLVGKPKFRFGIHYHGTRYWPDRLDLTIAALVATGAKLTRCDYDHQWSDIETAPGEYHWERSDAMIEKLRAAGLSLDIIFAFTPQWAMTPESLKKNAADRARGLMVRNCCGIPKPGLFQKFCERYARRYGTKIDYYETGNEWDLTPAETVTIDDLLRVQREAYVGLHAGHPGVTVIPNGWAAGATPENANPNVWSPGLIEAFANHPELYDAWAFHCHGETASLVYEIDARFLPLREKSGMKSRPWLLNETALSTFPDREDRVARTVWMKTLFGWSRGACDYVWYNLRATGWFAGDEPGYGLMTPDFRPRAGYAAFAALTTIFQGLDFDAILHSHKARHLFRFKGTSAAVKGLVIAGWDTQTKDGLRPIALHTDANAAQLVDFMGNRTTVAIKKGDVIFPLAFNPQALLLHGATFADVADAVALESMKPDGIVIAETIPDKAPTFLLNGTDHVRSDYAANPAMVHRMWKGPHDHSARVWLTATAQGFRLKARVTDDQRANGDRLELRLTEEGGRTRTLTFRPRDRKGMTDIYEEEIRVDGTTFGLDLRIHDDDGQGHDGYLFLRNETEEPLKVMRQRFSTPKRQQTKEGK